MNEFINSGYYFILTLIIYIIIVSYALYKISGFVNLKLKTIFAENKYLRKSILIFRKYFSEPFIRAVNSIIKQESNAVRLIRPADKFISEKIIPIITEPVNIISLIVRKIYNDNIQITLTYTTALIVVFYIILSIF